MKRPTALRAVAAGLIAAFAMAVAHAAPIYLVDATTDGQPPDAGLTNVGFSLQYEDLDGNHLFSLSELLSFLPVFDGTNYFEELIGLPDLPGLVGTGGNEWVFRDSFPDMFGGTTVADWHTPAAMFTPFTSDPFGAPEPGSLALGLTCLAALGMARRQRTPAALASRLVSETSG